MNDKNITIALNFIKRQFDDLKSAVQNQRIVTDISGAATALDKAASNLEKGSKALGEATKSQNLDILQRSLIQLASSISGMAKSVGSVKQSDMSGVEKGLSRLSKQLSQLKLEVPKTDLSRLDDVVVALMNVQEAIEKKEEAEDRTDEIVSAIKAIKVQIPESMKLDASQVGAIRFGGGGGGATASNARKAITTNVAMALADTEYSHKFSANTIGFRLRLRSPAVLMLYSWQAGTLPTSGTGAAYSTLQQNNELVRDTLDIGGKTLYLQTGSATQVVEVEEFTLQ